MQIPDGKYGPYKAITFDLWKAKSNKPTPLMVYIHGGGLASGDKRQIGFRRVKAILDAGISVIAINYRLTGEAVSHTTIWIAPGLSNTRDTTPKNSISI